MNTHADKIQENKSKAVANSFSEQQSSSESTFPFTDNRPEAIAQRRLQQMMNQSHQVRQLRAFYNQANSAARASDRKPEGFNSLERASETTAPIQRARDVSFPGIYENTDDFKSEDFQVTYTTPEEEQVTEERERPQKAEFNVHAPAGSKVTPSPLAFFSPTAERYDDLAGYHGGHIFGYELGGPGDPINIVPMLPAFNTGTWRGWEQQTWQLASEIGQGNLRISIEIEYDNSSDPRIPNRFLFSRTAYGPDGMPIYKDFGPIPHEVLEPPAMGPEEQEERKQLLALSEREDVRGVAFQNFISSTSKMWNRTIEPWLKRYSSLEEALWPIFAEGHLPPIEPPLFHPDVTKRPYEQLDILNISGAISFSMPEGYEVGADFTANQKEWILETNRARNGGVLKSDDPEDPHQELLVGGTLNRPEIDHVVPKGKGGSNFFANARVVSWELNNKIARIKKV